jgi:hypothetical protein
MTAASTIYQNVMEWTEDDDYHATRLALLIANEPATENIYKALKIVLRKERRRVFRAIESDS